MLTSVSISNYALIESLEIDFPDGLIIITGETGAGKSILLGAISLLLGNKAEKNILKDNKKNCVVEAVFQIDKESGINVLFEENDIIFSEELIIRKVISPGGRSRSFVNDQPVNNKFLKEISQSLIDIHAQHEHLLLSDSGFRLSVLDSYASNKKIHSEYTKAYTQVRELQKKKEQLDNKIEKQEQDHQYNQFQYNQLEQASLSPDEIAELEENQKILGNAEELKSILLQINEHLNPGGTSVVQILREVESLYEKTSCNLKATSDMAGRTETARVELKELERETAELADSIVSDPNKLAYIEDRLSAIYSLYKKYRVNSIEELIAIKEEYENKLTMATGHKEEAEKLSIIIEEQINLLEKLANDLSLSRLDASKRFTQEMTARIRELEMPHAKFDVSIHKLNNYTPNGKDKIEFFFSANKNSPPKEISVVASGGELSRIMLCLKTIMSRENDMPTLIFDEIDSGVSGSIADKMGALIDELSSNMQLFAITHLPQIASRGKCHLLVYKDITKEGKATTKIKKIEHTERMMEIARMLSGSELTKAAIANAKEFLLINKNN